LNFLPKPFKLVGDTRQDETSAHVAVREALINCIVHAQYGGSRRINIYKTPKGIVMSNPGTLLMSVQQFYEGGKSEARNPALQKMFGLIGKSDKAGSGVDKIMQGWKDANWRQPYIEETGKPDKVELFLPMESLISDEVISELKNIFGDGIDTMEHNCLSVLAFAAENDEISNGSLQTVLELHPTDITKLLRQLCRNGYLLSSGFGRGTTYHLNRDYKLSTNVTSSDASYVPRFGASSDASFNKLNRSESADVTSSDASSDASSVTSSNEPSAEEIQMIKEFCRTWKNISEISHAIGRSRSHTRNRIINKLLQAGILEMEFPDKPTHPAQRYRVKH